MFTAALFIIDNKWKQAKYLATEEWKSNGMLFIYEKSADTFYNLGEP